MKTEALACITLGALLASAGPLPGQDVSDSLDSYLHKNATINLNLSPLVPIGEQAALDGRLVIPPRVAAAFAVHHLRQKGVAQILVCEVQWIAGAVSGYLVDALGSASIDGARFSVFRVGIRDGDEQRHGTEYQAGSPFVFIALGWGEAGKPLWYPPPGPDAHFAAGDVIPEGALAYEYLLERSEFESLPQRYPRPAR